MSAKPPSPVPIIVALSAAGFFAAAAAAASAIGPAAGIGIVAAVPEGTDAARGGAAAGCAAGAVLRGCPALGG
jgi:hypothetical protein